jgi:hypothetical protein
MMTMFLKEQVPFLRSYALTLSHSLSNMCWVTHHFYIPCFHPTLTRGSLCHAAQECARRQGSSDSSNGKTPPTTTYSSSTSSEQQDNFREEWIEAKGRATPGAWLYNHGGDGGDVVEDARPCEKPDEKTLFLRMECARGARCPRLRHEVWRRRYRAWAEGREEERERKEKEKEKEVKVTIGWCS